MRVKIIILILSITLNALAQKEDIKYAAFNVVSGGITSSAIACFNKPKGQKLGKTFINAFWKGCLGGSLNYTGKKLIQVSSINNTYAYVWPGRIVNSLGSSIIYNGAKNEGLLQSVNINIFFANIEYNGKLHVKIDPISIGFATFLSFKKDYKFDFKNSLLIGSIYFERKQDSLYARSKNTQVPHGTSVANTFYSRYVEKHTFTGKDTIKIIDGYQFPDIILTEHIQNVTKKITCHEIIHTFQYLEYNSFNELYLNKLKMKLFKYININVNFGIVYLINNIRGYDNNLFEKEADFFGNTNYPILTGGYYH